MVTKGFVALLVAVLVLGGGLGGAFAGGIALGKSQGEKEARSAQPARSTPVSGQQSQGQMSQEQLQQMRQQFQGQLGQGGDQGLMGRGGLTGTVEKIEGNVVTINTAQGPLRATISADTAIQMMSTGTARDLKMGLTVTVVGQRGEDGTVTARSVLITPEGDAGFFGGGFFGGRQQQGQQAP
ncbi:MAG: hypothetical protein HYU29_00480 [Chloroflexi bacterium]|nr:hypothetical protein [Chloroflexota bacterium]